MQQETKKQESVDKLHLDTNWLQKLQIALPSHKLAEKPDQSVAVTW